MTLILTLRQPAFVMQASDRKVSLTTRQGVYIREHDPEANKSLIYHAEDGIFTLAYSGPAYIGGKATDHWLGDTMRGEPFREGFSVCQGYIPGWRKRHAALCDLAEALDGAYRDFSPLTPIMIQGAGWSLNSRTQWGARPFAFTIEEGGSRDGPNSGIQYFEGDGLGIIGSGAAYLRPEGVLQDLATGPFEVLALARGLANAIERVSQRDTGVSPAALVVVLLPPRREGSGVAYYTPNYNTIEDSPLGLEPPVLYSPWILSQLCTWAPSRMWGNTIPLPEWPLLIPLNEPDYDGPVMSLIAPQRRQPPPP